MKPVYEKVWRIPYKTVQDDVWESISFKLHMILHNRLITSCLPVQILKREVIREMKKQKKVVPLPTGLGFIP